MQIDRRRLLTTATCAVLTGVACAPVARPVEPDGPAAGRFHPLTHALLDRARRAGANWVRQTHVGSNESSTSWPLARVATDLLL